ncbi:hypothetical protein ACSBR2_032400 [Camellia fascicularis]
MFLYCDTVPSLCNALSQMYAHAHNDVHIFELYQEIAHTSQSTLGLIMAEFFGYTQARWEELAQYEPLIELLPKAASLVPKCLAR